MSRLRLVNYDVEESNITRQQLSERYFVNILDSNTFPQTYLRIYKYQRKEKNQVEKLKRANYNTKLFHVGVNTLMLIYKKDTFFVPNFLQKYAVDWYHTCLLHPGTEQT